MRPTEKLAVSAVCFDLDGTLLDTVPLIVASHQFALADFPHLSTDTPYLISTIGLPLEAVYNEKLLGSGARNLMNRFIDHNIAHTQTHIAVFRGIVPMLEQLRATGIPLGVVTAKRRDQAIMALDLFDMMPYFDVVLGREDSSRHKPDPEPLKEALRRLQIEDSRRLLYVGDSIYDLMAANNLGSYSAAVAWSQTSREALLEQNPTLWLEQAHDLPAKIRPV